MRKVSFVILNDVNCHAAIGCVFRFNPYSSFNKCKICKQTVHQAHSHYCQGMSITYMYRYNDYKWAKIMLKRVSVGLHVTV